MSRLWGFSLRTALAAVFLSACGNEGESENVSLADVAYDLSDPKAWTALAASEDPLSTHQPSDIACTEDAYGEESGGFEVATERCNYLSVTQPTQIALKPGARLQIGILHYDLVAAQEAEAHLALLVGSRLVWERLVPIPSAAGVIADEVVLKHAFPEDTAVVFHLHNHGYNSWKLFELRVAQ